MSGWGEFVLHRGVEIVHVTGTRIVIGRSEACDVTCHNSGVSRRHCELIAGPDGVLLRDLGSTHGTWVDGKRVKREQLRAGSVITLGPKGARLLLVEGKYMGRSVLAPPEPGSGVPPVKPQKQKRPPAQPTARYEHLETAEIVLPREPGFGRGMLWGVLGGSVLGVAALLLADFGPLLERAREALERVL